MEKYSFWRINTKPVEKLRMLKRQFNDLPDLTQGGFYSAQIFIHTSGSSAGSSTASGKSSTSVTSVIFTIPAGDVEKTCNLISPRPNEPPKNSGNTCSNITSEPNDSLGRLTLVVDMISPFETVLL